MRVEIEMTDRGIIAVALCAKKFALKVRTGFGLVDCSKHYLGFVGMSERSAERPVLLVHSGTIEDYVEADDFSFRVVDRSYEAC
jgi:hypothetical protein